MQQQDQSLASMPVEEREAAIHARFLAEGLTPPANIGRLSQGQPEIVDILDFRQNKPFFQDVVLNVQWAPGADAKPFVVRSNMNGAGAVFVPIFGTKVALVKQFRTALGRYTLEVPRGFSAAWDPARTEDITVGIDTLPKGFATVIAELSEEVLKSGQIVPQFLGDIAENSGTTTTSPSYWLLNIQAGAEFGGSEEGLKVKLVDISEIPAMLGTTINDNHSIVALCLALNRLK